MSRFKTMGDYELVEHITSEVAHSGAGLGDWPTSAINELHRRLADRARLATPASAPVGGTTEIVMRCDGCGLEYTMRPAPPIAEHRRKHDVFCGVFRPAARAAERRDQEEGR